MFIGRSMIQRIIHRSLPQSSIIARMYSRRWMTHRGNHPRLYAPRKFAPHWRWNKRHEMRNINNGSTIKWQRNVPCTCMNICCTYIEHILYNVHAWTIYVVQCKCMNICWTCIEHILYMHWTYVVHAWTYVVHAWTYVVHGWTYVFESNFSDTLMWLAA